MSLTAFAWSAARQCASQLRKSRLFSAVADAQRYNPEGPKGIQFVQERVARRRALGDYLTGALVLIGGGVTWWAFRDPLGSIHSDTVEFTNWSATHSVTCRRVFEPESEDEVMQLVQKAVAQGWQLRAVGSGISPNGLGFSSNCMISMALMDRVLDVDREAMQVRVQAGAKVQDVVEALRPYGLTLQNFASVREQQVGGFTQVSAHGTGARLPPVDEQVVSLRLASPAFAEPVTLSKGDDTTFDWVRVGLGGMGVVTELTLQCVPAHRLLEETAVVTRTQVKRNHAKCEF